LKVGFELFVELFDLANEGLFGLQHLFAGPAVVGHAGLLCDVADCLNKPLW
jgi:hypothetical protein